jgi:Tfp pilus assembly protein PilF
MDPASADYEHVLELAVQLNSRNKLYSRVIDYARQYLERRPSDVDMRVMLAQAHYLSGEYPQARNEIDAAIDAQTQLRREIPESWLAIKLASTGLSGDMQAMERLRQELLQNYPQHERAFARTGSTTRACC